jgi:hypothetical protein
MKHEDKKSPAINGLVQPKKTRSVKRWLKRRSAIESVIEHVKSKNGIARDGLKGIEGDKINALLSGCGLILQNCWQFSHYQQNVGKKSGNFSNKNQIEQYNLLNKMKN